MKSATINEIRKELSHLEEDQLRTICLRLAKYKVENKEMITYLLYEAHNESAYVQSIITDLIDEFSSIPADTNAYYIKKSLRRVLRRMNRQIKYSGIPETELEVRLEFCQLMRQRRIPMKEGTVLFNIYAQQLKKVRTILAKLPEDKRGDYVVPA